MEEEGLGKVPLALDRFPLHLQPRHCPRHLLSGHLWSSPQLVYQLLVSISVPVVQESEAFRLVAYLRAPNWSLFMSENTRSCLKLVWIQIFHYLKKITICGHCHHYHHHHHHSLYCRAWSLNICLLRKKYVLISGCHTFLLVAISNQNLIYSGFSFHDFFNIV